MDPLKEDFRRFLFLLWRHLRLPVPTPVQYDIAHYLQHGPRRKVIEAFRGVGKSWITAAYVCWVLYCNPNERVLVVSASKDRADSFSIFVRRIIEEFPPLAHLRPEPGLRDSTVAFDVGGSAPHQSPSVRSVGITGQMTGGRASKIIADDIETPKNSLTQIMRDRTAELVKEFDAILMAEEDLKALGINRAEVVYLGTPQCEMSLYNDLPARGYAVRIWPARYPESADRYRGRLAPMLANKLEQDPTLGTACNGRGTPTDPTRFTDLDLLEREASYGRSGFSLQFMLDTSLSDADRYPLKLSDFIVLDTSPTVAPVKLAWGSGAKQVINDLPVVGLSGDRWHSPMYVSDLFTEYEGCVMFIDPSGRGKDETGYAIVAMLKGNLYLLEAGGFRNGYDGTTLLALANVAKRNGVKHIRIEENFGGGMFTSLLTPVLAHVYPCTTEDIRSSVQKEKRIIDTLEPLLNGHKLVVSKKLIEADLKIEEPAYQLFYQLTRITKDKGSLLRDDKLDALAGACAYWVEMLGADQVRAEEDHRNALLDEELERFFGDVDHGPVHGKTGPRSPSWLNNYGSLQGLRDKDPKGYLKGA